MRDEWSDRPEPYRSLDPADPSLTRLQRERLIRSNALKAKLAAPRECPPDATIVSESPEEPEPGFLSLASLRSTKGLPRGAKRPLEEPCMRCGRISWRLKIRSDGRQTRDCRTCGARRSRESDRRKRDAARIAAENERRTLELHRSGKSLPVTVLEERMQPLLRSFTPRVTPRGILADMARTGQIGILEDAGRKYAVLLDQELGRAAATLDPSIFQDDESRFARERHARRAAA